MSTSRQQQGRHQGHIARKRFGQNFLVDMGVIDSIVDVIRPQRGERMVEIGPGLGATFAELVYYYLYLRPLATMPVGPPETGFEARRPGDAAAS